MMRIAGLCTGKGAVTLLAPLEILVYRLRVILFLTGLAFFMVGFSAFLMAQPENVTFRYVAVNPSATKTQEVEIKKYLPQEITHHDIVDVGNLELKYDTQKSQYYVYTTVTLSPKELRSFEVEVQDVWFVPEQELSQLETQVDAILAHFETTPYYPQGKAIADTVYARLDEIRSSQAKEEPSRQRHIGIYRENMSVIEDIEEDIARMEKILVTAGGPQAPQMLADTKIKADAPSKTMTWIVIFVIITFVGLLAGVMFFTWQRQANITRESIAKSKRSAFPGLPEEGDGLEQNPEDIPKE